MAIHKSVNVPLAPSFTFKELVPQSIYNLYSDDPLFLVHFFDPKALRTLQKLRDKFGSCIVNNWSWGGANQYRGYRPLDCTIGAKRSQHKLGKAFDCSFKNYTAQQVRDYVLAHPQEFPYITAIEGQVSWFHFDVRTPTWTGIKVFNP
ncbi:hypothetical protein [Pseudoalteromonas sp. 1_2015MBL_MicDiv]|uniref:hypothetical protein n=1 Tax=Pseudoalteromonas sp. 1_2015MBL_MicDiv TaxID=1720343 RepID=UPI000BBE2176|nr:hypothetical protein [Pseudoalteromonas sp. 1_2015MBL_MicDiv]ATG77625.1 hypothetical protein AOR04_08805 [Pseudoalteromonas sp. 1_2015MBL_MicDiv]